MRVSPSSHCRIAVQPLPLSTRDRKSTRLNSSHLAISYAVFRLKKKAEPLKATNYMAIGFYLTEHSNKHPDMKLSQAALGSNSYDHTLQTNLILLPKNVHIIRMW